MARRRFLRRGLGAAGLFGAGVVCVLVWVFSWTWEGWLAAAAVRSARTPTEQLQAFEQVDSTHWDSIGFYDRGGAWMTRAAPDWETAVGFVEIHWKGGPDVRTPLLDPANLRAFHDCGTGVRGKYGIVWIGFGLVGLAMMVRAGAWVRSWYAGTAVGKRGFEVEVRRE